jgi:alpha-amylase/alpha-mannosidase (GH57 family)
MAKLTVLWHLHQPMYRTADNRVHAPWTLLHAAGEYLTLTRVIERTGWQGQVLNLVPVFVEQLAAYRDGIARDPLLEALRTPARELEPEGQRELLRWAFLMHPHQLRRWPRLAELAGRANGAAADDLRRRYTVQDLTDLQVLLVLAYAAPNLPWEPELAAIAETGRNWGAAAREQTVAWLAECPGRVLASYRSLAERDGVEIATSPYAHPIMPLLIDTAVVPESWAPHPPPPFPRFAAPADAAAHLKAGLKLMHGHGFSPHGCWPPEGSVSAAAVGVYGRHKIRWLCTDEGILAASLGRAVSGETGVGDELFRSWRLEEGGPALFFRHRGLSDFIGFQGARFGDEAAAARELVAQIRRVARQVPSDAGILIALDGENPWTSYPDGGARFLTTLAGALERCDEIQPATLGERVADEVPLQLPRLHPGSWIGGTFGTWIGHPEKNRGWEYLRLVRSLGGAKGGASWLAAEGSDWWWWFGDDNPTLLAPLYDELFRAHLRDACVAAGVPPPAELSAPVRSRAVRLKVPRSRTWPAPALDGRTTNFFEWAVAAWAEAPAGHRRLARVAMRASDTTLWLRAEARPHVGPPAPLTVTVVCPTERVTWTLPDDRPQQCGVGSCVEAAVPLPEGTVLIGVEHRGERLPVDGFWSLELVDVDET